MSYYQGYYDLLYSIWFQNVLYNDSSIVKLGAAAKFDSSYPTSIT